MRDDVDVPIVYRLFLYAVTLFRYFRMEGYIFRIIFVSRHVFFRSTSGAISWNFYVRFLPRSPIVLCLVRKRNRIVFLVRDPGIYYLFTFVSTYSTRSRRFRVLPIIRRSTYPFRFASVGLYIIITINFPSRDRTMGNILFNVFTQRAIRDLPVRHNCSSFNFSNEYSMR